MRWHRIAWIGVSLLCSTASARAQQSDEPLAVTWDAPDTCPGQQQLLAAIERRLGGPPAAGRARLLAVARVFPESDGRYRVELHTDLGGVVGQRQLKADSCAALAEATALVLALTFDPDSVAAASPSSRAEAPAPAPPTVTIQPPSSRAVEAVAPGKSDALPRGWRLAFHASGGATIGALPGVAFGFGGGLAITWSRARLGGEFAYFPARRATVDGGPAGADFMLLYGTISGSYAILLTPFELSAGVHLELGRVAAEGVEVPRTGQGASVWVAPGAQALGRLPVFGPVGVRAEVSASVPLFRPRFVLDELGTVHRAAPVVGLAELGVEVRF